jgi:hypothetical protein
VVPALVRYYPNFQEEKIMARFTTGIKVRKPEFMRAKPGSWQEQMRASFSDDALIKSIRTLRSAWVFPASYWRTDSFCEPLWDWEDKRGQHPLDLFIQPLLNIDSLDQTQVDELISQLNRIFQRANWLEVQAWLWAVESCRQISKPRAMVVQAWLDVCGHFE